MIPVSCDGIHEEILTGIADFTWLWHAKKGSTSAEWVKVTQAKYMVTSSSGETFNVREHDPGIEVYDADGNWVKETGTWRFIMIGDRGSHYRITWAYSISPDPMDPNNLIWDWSLLEAKCR